jgi:two-component system chemotaxis sensor kinase CheA
MCDAEIVREFLVESYENLDRLDRDLVSLEGAPSDKEILASIFRTIHTIKGTAGFLLFGKLEKLTHAGENLLARLRDAELHLNPEITTSLLAMVDAVRDMLASVEHVGNEGERDDQELIETMTRLLHPEEEASHASSIDPKEIRSKNKDNDVRPALLLHELPVGEILVSLGAAKESDIHAAVKKQNAGDRRQVGELLVESGAVTPQDVLDALNVQQIARGPSASDSTVRVDVNLLDRLMNLVSELVLTRNQILQFTSSAKASSLLPTSQRLNLITTELHEGVMKTRMQAIANIWNKYPRTVRDVALTCGKQVRIEMEGKEIELDKTIIEAIKDPLTHLVRNAIDHGIETPQARHAAGKPPEGLLRLRAFYEGGQVNIEISDDGAGIDHDKIRSKAVQKGLISGDQATRMTDREVTNLIFMPGFSTAAKVTNVSGRGVGLDVVKTNVEKIGGTVEVQSKAGVGSTVRMRIPLRESLARAASATE